ncbi:MAG: hypothetical protein A4E66_00578 [Syntrophus sp. PtaB.Bin001]|nr:MAG: hypothetical protein A4E66_00578 [Syntrophus sp. PtaB.Bin001]
MSLSGIPVLEDLYPVTMDMWPIESKDFNRIHPFYENLKAGKLTTTRCKACGAVSYPPRVICPDCYSDDLEYIELPQKGRVIVFTETIKGVPLGYTSPLIHAYIDLGENSPVKRLLIRVVNCAAGQLKEGDELKLVILNVPSHPIEKGKTGNIMSERVFFAFEPVNK